MDMRRVAYWMQGFEQSASNTCRYLAGHAGIPLALAILLASSIFGQLAQAGFGGAPLAFAASLNTSAGKNPYHAPADRGGKTVFLPNQIKNVTAPPKWNSIWRPTGVTMKPQALLLSAIASSHLLGSDKRLEVTVPAGAVTPALLAKAGGVLYLHVSQLMGPSGGSNSGQVLLGAYSFTLVGAQGQTMNAALAKPLQVSLHLTGWRGAGFDLLRTQLVIPPKARGAKPVVIKTAYNSKNQTLDAIMPFTASPFNSFWNTDAPNAQVSQQSDATVNLPAGDMEYSYPINVPSGPGGLKPNLTLAYSSGSVAAQHYPESAADWLGEGWDLSVGSISWEERNVLGLCTAYSCNCDNCSGVQWESTWQFADSYGNGGELIPPDTIDAPWLDDSPNSANNLTPEPLTWHLSEEQHVKVISYNNPHPPSQFPSNVYITPPPCFRAFLPNGIMEEFGCTNDSLEWYVNGTSSSGAQYPLANYIYRWNLDMIVDPDGNQIHFTYRQVLNEDYNLKDPTEEFPLDSVLSSITYDSPACHNRNSMCTGGAWQPAVQITFSTDYAPARSTGASCPTFQQQPGVYNLAQTMRCDDVPDLQEEGGVLAPKVQSVLVLNDINVQVTTSPASNPVPWHTLLDYQMSYEQAPSGNTYYHYANPLSDPLTGQPMAIAGYTDLTQIKAVGDDINNGSGTSLPPLTMSYTTYDEYYEDAMNNNLNPPAPQGNCPWWWNSGDGACPMWTQSFNARYLTKLDNGRGWEETFTYGLARNNTHGVNSGNLLNPLACDASGGLTPLTGSPCNTADDENWSRIVLTSRAATVVCKAADGSSCGTDNSGNLTSTWGYTYVLTDVSHLAKMCNNCNQMMYWGNANDGDTLDFYNEHFMGFSAVNVTPPDGSLQVYSYYSTEGVGLFCTTTSNCPSGNNPVPCAAFSGICGPSPWTDRGNRLHGWPKEEDDYDVNKTTLLKQTVYTTDDWVDKYCPPLNVPPSPSNTTSNHQYVGELTSEMDWTNPITVCEDQPFERDTYEVDGGAPLSGTHTTVINDVDWYWYAPNTGSYLALIGSDTSASNPGATADITHWTWLTWNDGVAISNGIPVGTYILQLPSQELIQDAGQGNANIKACTYDGYDGGTPGATYQQNSITKGHLTRSDSYYTSCTSGSPSGGPVSTSATYDANTGNPLGTMDADAMAGIAGHTDATDCTINGSAYSACAQYDALYDAMPTVVFNALGQKTQLNYTTDGSNTNSPDATNGWGQWLTTETDPNNQVSAYGYDALGRLTAEAQPGDTLTAPTTSYTYPVTCPTTGPEQPCTALDTTQRLTSAGATTTSATYYDGWGRQIETVSIQNNVTVGTRTTITYDVQYTLYDASGRVSVKSDPYFVVQTYLAPPVGAPAYRAPDTTQPHTSYAYDGLGRALTTTDPLGHVTTTSYAELQPQGANVNDTNVYAGVIMVDANGHKAITLSDGFGRVRYTETFTGNGTSGGPYALYGTSALSYDYLGDVTSVTGPNPPPGSPGLSTTPQTTTTYDLLGRLQSSSDADLGAWASADSRGAYDSDGNLLQVSNPNGVTVYAGYDGLNRQLWRNTTNSQTGAYVTYTYDSTAGGNLGKGRLTQETFTGGTSSDPLSGSYSYIYDGRGRVTTFTQTTTENASYSLNMGYNDANQTTSITYSDVEQLSLNYSAYDWLTSLVTLPSGGSSTNLFTSIAYSGSAGAAGVPTAASLTGTSYTYSASYDNDLRLTSSSLALSGTTLFSSTRTYDNVGNVTTADTQLAAGTDNQAFCYDEQDRLVWATSQTATGPNNCASNTAGNLTAQGAQYTASYTYDALDRITSSSAMGSYTYGDPNHLHAATTTGNGYTSSYGSAGQMQCRAPTSATTCAGGSPNGAQLTYDAELRLNHWQNAPGGSPTSSADFLYDGEGHRAEQLVTGSSGTTKVYYLFGGSEELTVGGSGSTLIKYYPSAGGALPGVVSVNGTISYAATDGLGSLNEALSSSGSVTAQQLYTPYGTVRYTSGTMPTAKGFTGQYADAGTGLSYYNARYYDPSLGQFTSADDTQGPNRYAYVDDNPETHNDPTGHIVGCLADAFQARFAGGSWLGTAATCAGDAAQGVRAAAQAKAATKILDVALRQYKSGNFRYLTQQGAEELGGLTSRGALAEASLAGLKNPLSALGVGSDSSDYVLNSVKKVIGTSGDVLEKGIGGGRSHIGVLEGALEDTGSTLSHLKVPGKVLGVAGFLLTGAVAGIGDYNAHHDAVRAVAVGLTHAVLSTGGALLFGAAGGAVGSLFGPGGTVIGSFIGASVGGWLGDQAASGLVNLWDAWTAPPAPAYRNTSVNGGGNIFSAFGGLFG